MTSISKLAPCAEKHLREYTDPNGPFAFATYDLAGAPSALQPIDCLAPALLNAPVAGASVIAMRRPGTPEAASWNAMRDLVADPGCAATDFIDADLDDQPTRSSGATSRTGPCAPADNPPPAAIPFPAPPRSCAPMADPGGTPKVTTRQRRKCGAALHALLESLGEGTGAAGDRASTDTSNGPNTGGGSGGEWWGSGVGSADGSSALALRHRSAQRRTTSRRGATSVRMPGPLNPPRPRRSPPPSGSGRPRRPWAPCSRTSAPTPPC
jgi:hypothetical protein